MGEKLPSETLQQVAEFNSRACVVDDLEQGGTLRLSSLATETFKNELL